ncbi:TRAP transporter large permease [Paracandidimonas soli]|uniref:TRAP transporter large permease protein n=1 Tax=Paracandidimonas soli TaxID=1917182 RepID=A0A4R3V8P2_9BURK|nr:TRAP transporter large permease [Paracandidimonas soli]TCV01506.1 tripartite ATP-independent transporter DctM subunit [Paracandidimonas soli]
MSETSLIAILFGSFWLLLLLRVPLAFCLSLPTLLVIYLSDMPTQLLVERMYASLDYFPLLAIPFFILAGYLMNLGNITDRFINLAQALVGHIKGGLAQVNVVVSMMFASVSGTATADTAGMGSMLIPAMVKKGYSPGFSAAITAASSTMGAIIPPSVLMIVYGSLANLSMSKLFLAGVVPGILVGVSQMLIAYVVARKHDYPREARASAPEVVRAFRQCLLPLGIPVIIIGGIMAGIFTPTEAGVVAVAYAVLVIILLRSVSLRELPNIAKSASIMVSLPVFAIASAVAFGWMIAFLQVPNIVGEFIAQFELTQVTGLIFIFAIFLLIGCFLDGVPAIIIFLPIAQEIAATVGIDPMHMAIVIVMTAAMGLITPPFGLCILIAGSIAKVPVPQMIRASAPFVLAFIALIFLIIVFPQIALFLPQLLTT